MNNINLTKLCLALAITIQHISCVTTEKCFWTQLEKNIFLLWKTFSGAAQIVNPLWDKHGKYFV